MKPLYKFTKEDWYGLAVIIDNSFIGSLDTFTHDRHCGFVGFFKLSTNKCDDTSEIKVFTTEVITVSRITRLGEDTEGWQEIHKETLEKVLNYIKNIINMNEFKGAKGEWISDLRTGCCAVYPKHRDGETNLCSKYDDRNIFYSNKSSKFNGNNWEMCTETQYNAQLISCAPEMLEMLEKTVCHLKEIQNIYGFKNHINQRVLRIQQIIKKATTI